MALGKLDPKAHFTKPPARYSEAAWSRSVDEAWHWPALYLACDHFTDSGLGIRISDTRRFSMPNKMRYRYPSVWLKAFPT